MYELAFCRVSSTGLPKKGPERAGLGAEQPEKLVIFLKKYLAV